MEEVWRDIQGYEGLYQVSSLGRVRSIERLVDRGRYGYQLVKEKILRPRLHTGGYLRVNLCKDKKAKDHYIHRLVANAFLDNSLQLSEINHKDENKTNNTVSNLEWCTHIYNNSYGTKIERQKQTLIEHGYALPENERKERDRIRAKKNYYDNIEKSREQKKLAQRRYRARLKDKAFI